MIHDVRRTELTSLVDPDAPVRRIGTGFTFTEGPLWHPTGHYLLFSDMPGDVRRRWDEAGGVREVMRPSNKGNGMTYDADLNLVVCEHATSSLVRQLPDGRREVLASRFEGKELNSPNDVCVRSDGSIYFTDPWFGRMPHYGVERPRELGWQGVFRVSPDGALHLVVDRRQFDQPNGLCFSPDESRLYVNDTTRALIRAFDVAPDGALSHGRLFAQGIRSSREAGVPDGMKCDARGNVWVTAPGLTLNAPLFEGLADAGALVRGTWGAAPVESLEPRPGDHVVAKMRMSAWEGSSLETVLRSGGRDILIDIGAWTNMSIEHTARTGADKGYFMVVPEDACSTMNAEWHAASIGYAMRNVAIVTRTDEVIAALDAAAPGSGSAAPGSGSAAPGSGSAAPGSGSTALVAASPAPGAGPAEPGSGSAEPGSEPAAPGSGSAEAADEAIRRRMRERRARGGGGGRCMSGDDSAI